MRQQSMLPAEIDFDAQWIIQLPGPGVVDYR